MRLTPLASPPLVCCRWSVKTPCTGRESVSIGILFELLSVRASTFDPSIAPDPFLGRVRPTLQLVQATQVQAQLNRERAA